MRWDENFSSLLKERNLKINYEVTELGVSKTTVCLPGCEDEITLKEYLQEEQDQSLHELIRTNILNSTRNFQHRVDAFIKNIVFGDNNPMKIKHLSYKVEFQEEVQATSMEYFGLICHCLKNMKKMRYQSSNT